VEPNEAPHQTGVGKPAPAGGLCRSAGEGRWHDGRYETIVGDGSFEVTRHQFPTAQHRRPSALAWRAIRFTSPPSGQNGQADVIIAFENQAVRAAQAATSEIPVVFARVSDPVAAGFVTEWWHDLAVTLQPKRHRSKPCPTTP